MTEFLSFNLIYLSVRSLWDPPPAERVESCCLMEADILSVSIPHIIFGVTFGLTS